MSSNPSYALGTFNPSEPSEILSHIEDFIGGVVNDDLEDLPVDEAIWKLEASLNFVFRNTQAPLGQKSIDSLEFDLVAAGESISADDLKMMFHSVIDHCENAASELDMEVAFIDITPTGNGGLKVTPVYAIHLPPPPSIPNMGDWKANQHAACGMPNGNCSDESTSGNKISELVVHRYYYDIYNNQGLDGSYAHFHTGIYSAGVGYTAFFYCGTTSYPVDHQIQTNDVYSDWNLFGTAYWPNPIVTATSADQCITASEIEDYADYIENKSDDYNPGNNKMLFNFRMGHDFPLGSSSFGFHVPGIMNYGNFVYTPQNVQIYGY